MAHLFRFTGRTRLAQRVAAQVRRVYQYRPE